MSKLLVAPLEALTDDRLTDQERRVLLTLFSFRGKVSDTVWPGRELIGQRANIKDLGRVGKCTTSLCEKGWLVKWKTGWSGHNTYRLTFPDVLNSALTAEEVHLESCLALEAESAPNEDLPLGAEYAPHSGQNTPPHSGQNTPTALNTPDEQTNQQTIYKKIYLDLNDPLIELYKEFIDHRIQKKDSLSQYKFTLYLKSVQRCVDALHVTPEFVIEKTIEAGWKSVEPSWLAGRLPVERTKASGSIRGQSLEDSLTDTTWATDSLFNL
jgi:hypothetical protein